MMLKKIIKEALKIKPEKRQDYIDNEFEQLKSKYSFPLINGNEVTFVYKGEGNKIQISGDFTSWVHRITMNNIPGTDFFYLTKLFPSDSRLDYKIIVDDKLILDPLNNKIVQGGFGDNSFFSLKEYKENAYSLYNKNAPRGQIIEHSFYSNFMKEERLFRIYLPPNYSKEKKYKTVYFQDGNEYLRLANAAITLDNLINNKLIEEVIGVFVEPTIRHIDYLFNDNYVDYFIKEIVNFAENNYSSSKRVEDRFIVGDSLGGLVSTYIIFRYPGYFNGILSHSGALNFADKNRVFFRGTYYKGNPFLKKLKNIKLPKRWYLVCGNYEKKIALLFDFTKGNKKFYDYLTGNNLAEKAELKLYNEGHSWGLWKNTLPEGLIWLLN